ncbi:MAG: ABC transporter permease [Acidimicrobiales bacterium]
MARTAADVPHAGNGVDRLDEELAGLDALQLDVGREPLAWRVWRAAWPKAAAAALGITLWQVVVWSGWKPDYLLPPPGPVFSRLWDSLTDGPLPEAMAHTMVRAFVGFGLAVIIGTVVGSVVARVHLVRTAFGSFITGLQTMPSIAWFPLAILTFGLTEGAIRFVVVLGAAPAIANGLVTGTDQIPPILLRAGRVLGARGLSAYRHVILPASLPSYVGGLKQGWAFAWRSLMAGELLGVVPGEQSIGVLMQNSRSLQDAEGLLAYMVVILVIGIVVDSVFFGTLERSIRRRWGLLDPAT